MSNIFGSPQNVFLLKLYLGLRVGEALALKSTDINLDNDTIQISRTLTTNETGAVIMGKSTKTATGKRLLPIPQFLKEHIIEQLDYSKNNKDNLLFTYGDKLVHPHSDVKITLNTYTSIFNDFKLDEINKVNAYYERNNLLDDKEDVR